MLKEAIAVLAPLHVHHATKSLDSLAVVRAIMTANTAVSEHGRTRALMSAKIARLERTPSAVSTRAIIAIPESSTNRSARQVANRVIPEACQMAPAAVLHALLVSLLHLDQRNALTVMVTDSTARGVPRRVLQLQLERSQTVLGTALNRAPLENIPSEESTIAPPARKENSPKKKQPLAASPLLLVRPDATSRTPLRQPQMLFAMIVRLERPQKAVEISVKIVPGRASFPTRNSYLPAKSHLPEEFLVVITKEPFPVLRADFH